MTGQFRAELLKIRSTRTTVGLVVGMVGLILLFSLLTGLLTKAPNLVTTEDQRGLLVVGAYAGVFSALAGIMLVTSEYRYGTIKPTFVFTPRRSRVVVAKVAAGVLAGLVRSASWVRHSASVSAMRASPAAASTTRSTTGRPPCSSSAPSSAQRSGVGSAWASAPSSAARWQPSSESSRGPSSRRTYSSPFSPASGRFGPTHAEDALIGVATEHLLRATPGGLVLVAWAAALSLLGITLVARRDVD